jgi:glycosyltransferase involved in cell wall biosynthesis
LQDSAIRALAVLCVRNESIHIRPCLSRLISDGIDVVLIDHGSTDDSVAKARGFLGQGLISIESMPWRGVFSLRDQLQKKRELIAGTAYDWIVHVDADEWLCSHETEQTLLDGIREADAAGFNCINFNEFVFVPIAGENFLFEEYADAMSTYYFFQPTHPRLIRAWKWSEGFDNRNSGGHTLDGIGIRLFPKDYPLRHYPVLSHEQGCQKYLARPYDPQEISKNWHGKRLRITESNLRLPNRSNPFLRELSSPLSREFDTTRPTTTHFWEWQDAVD